MRRTSGWLRLLPALLALAGIAPAAGAEAPSAGDVVADHAWSRATVAGGTGVVYMTIRNKGEADDRLLGVTSAVARTAEMHQTRTDGAGVVSMTPISAVPVPAHGQAVFAPGGLHVMLVGLQKPLAAGQHFTLQLSFDKAGIVPVTVTVQKAGTRAFDDMGGMKM